MEKEYYNISGEFCLNITVCLEDKSDIPDMRVMQRLLEEAFDAAVDNYCEKFKIEYEEIHPILCDGLHREREY